PAGDAVDVHVERHLPPPLWPAPILGAIRGHHKGGGPLPPVRRRRDPRATRTAASPVPGATDLSRERGATPGLGLGPDGRPASGHTGCSTPGPREARDHRRRPSPARGDRPARPPGPRTGGSTPGSPSGPPANHAA